MPLRCHPRNLLRWAGLLRGEGYLPLGELRQHHVGVLFFLKAVVQHFLVIAEVQLSRAAAVPYAAIS